ncbi:MAG: hypothetical protein ACO3O9_02715 [Candidatus Nanopelagicales bacterium]
MKISAARAFVNGQITPATIEIEGPRIVDVTNEIESGSDIRIADGEGVLTPGLIDLQINGGFGIDFQQTDSEGFQAFRKEIIKTGVTGFFPTLITASQKNLLQQLAQIELASDKGISDVLGVHLEGPYISKAACGTHEEKQIREINLAEIKELVVEKKVKILTLAQN